MADAIASSIAIVAKAGAEGSASNMGKMVSPGIGAEGSLRISLFPPAIIL
jgi:hypothetical protein